MTRPPEPPEIRDDEGLPDQPSQPADDRQLLRAAFLRPMNLLMLFVGLFAAAFISGWFLPITAVTYALLVLLASRDPLFAQQVLGDRRPSIPQPVQDISLERRVRWLPRGETRRKLEEALDVYRKLVAAIEESNDVTRTVLEDAVPKLHAAADRLVDVGTHREKTATVISELRSLSNTREDHEAALQKLEDEVRNADTEISRTYEQLIALRARIAQVSTTNDPENRATAAQMNASLDELNLRLEALEETMAPYDEHLNLPEDSPEQNPPN